MDSYEYYLPNFSNQLKSSFQYVHISRSIHLKVYGEDLKSVNEVSLNIPSDAKCSFTHMLVSELYFIFFDLAKGSEIVLMDKDSGSMFSKFSLSSRNFVLEKSLNYVFAFESRSNELVCYSCDGEQERLKVNNKDTTNKLELVDCLDKNLLFLDSSSLNFYF